MAAINHTFVEQNTQQTTTSGTYVAVPGASIGSGNFVAGKKYLLYITSQISVSTARAARYRVVHGSTAFAESELIEAKTFADRGVYRWFTVWTAVSGEDILMEFRSDGTATARIDQIAVLAINLTDDVVENTDWFFAELATDTTINSTAFSAGASVTFTPGAAGHDWLVAVYAQLDANSTAQSIISRISRTGEAASTLPQIRGEPSAITQQFVWGSTRVFNLGAASNTLGEEASTSGTTNQTRLHSAIFILNLNKFRNHANVYTEADLALGITDYGTEIQTLGLTPDVEGLVWIGGYWGFDVNNAGRTAKFRIQVDGSDQPAGQTTDNYTFRQMNDATDEDPHELITLATLTAAAHTIDLDASVSSTTSAPTAQQRTLWAVTMELPAGEPPPGPSPGLRTLSLTGVGL